MLSAYWLLRLFWAIPTLFGVALIVFVLLRVAPGDPIAMLIPPGARAQDIANLREFHGLDKPIWQQFVIWLGAVAQGNFGNAIGLARECFIVGAFALAGDVGVGFPGDCADARCFVCRGKRVLARPLARIHG